MMVVLNVLGSKPTSRPNFPDFSVLPANRNPHESAGVAVFKD